MKIDIPDALVDQLVTSTDARVEANAGLGRTAGPATAADSRFGDRMQLQATLGRAVNDQTDALVALKAAVYTARTGKGLPEGA